MTADEAARAGAVLALGLLAACNSAPSQGGGGGGSSTTSTHTVTSSSATSSSTGGAGGTGGAMNACTPGETRPCYTGPAGTEGVGICKGGMQACNASGVGYGPCTGEVVPKPESCLTAEDDNCDGMANEGCLCTPGASAPCYTGPSGTEGVGVCHGGTQICDLSGKAYGPCLNELEPQVENCASTADEDCDGQTPPCTGAYVSARAFGSASDEEGLAVAADPAGNVVLVGYTTGTVDFGCGPVPGGSAPGGFVAKLDPAGACLWSKRIGDGSQVNAVAVGSGGDVLIAGDFSATLDLGGMTLQSAGQLDAFFARLDPSGAPVWARRFGDAANQSASGIGIDDAGNFAGTGTFQGTIDLGGGAVASQGGNDVFVVKLDSSGTFMWGHTFGDASNQTAAAVAISAGYEITITGALSGSADFGGGPLQSAGLGDVFIAHFDQTGGHLWSRTYGDAKDQGATTVRGDPMGNVYVAGVFDGTLDLGGASYVTAGGQDAWLLALDGNGNYRWSRQGGGANTQSAAALAVDAYHNVAFGGVLVGAADFGTGLLTSAGAADAFVAKYDPAGAPLWSARFGDSASQILKGLAFDGAGDLLLAGVLVGTADFGGGALAGAGGEDVFFAKLAP